jgi:uncharacterized protein with ATP-grasp and redox domains
LQAAVDGYCKFWVKQTVGMAKIATKDPEVRREALVAVIEQLPSFPVDLPPPRAAQTLYSVIKGITGNQDPYAEIKERYTRPAQGKRQGFT